MEPLEILVFIDLKSPNKLTSDFFTIVRYLQDFNNSSGAKNGFWVSGVTHYPTAQKGNCFPGFESVISKTETHKCFKELKNYKKNITEYKVECIDYILTKTKQPYFQKFIVYNYSLHTQKTKILPNYLYVIIFYTKCVFQLCHFLRM